MENINFETWNGSIPADWTLFTLPSSTVLITRETTIKREGANSVKLETDDYPSAGIEQNCLPDKKIRFQVDNQVGRTALHFAKANGNSCAFTDRVKIQDHFMTDAGYTTSAIRNALAVRLDNGDLMEIFSASNSAEVISSGEVYAKRNGGTPYLFRDDESVKNFAWAEVLDLGTKYVWVQMRLYEGAIMKIHATDINRDFTVQSNDRLLFEMANTDVQVYNVIKLPSGKIVLPMVYCESSLIMQGPWYLDVLTSDDNLETVQRLNAPQTMTGRGIMEPHPVLLSTGIVAFLCRTALGFVARADYDPVANTISQAYLTDMAQSETSMYAMNLANGDILMIYTGGAFRYMIGMAISSDDMLTWHSYHTVECTIPEGYTFIHQPFAMEEMVGGKSKLTIYYEAVYSTTNITLYKVESDDYIRNNVNNELNTWKILAGTSPANVAKVQLLNILNLSGISYWDSGSELTEAQELYVYSNGEIVSLPLENALGNISHEVIVRKSNRNQKLIPVSTGDSFATPIRAMINGLTRSFKKTQLVFTTPASFIVAENTTSVGYVTASPADCLYSIEPGGDGAQFSIDSMTGKLQFIAAPDFEVPTDLNSDNIYQVTVRATRYSITALTTTQTINVSVVNIVDEVGAILYSDRTFTWLDSQDPTMITKDVNNFVSIWWDKVYGATNLGPDLTAISTTIGRVYKIISCDPNYFYAGCQPNDIYVAAESKYLNGNNRAQLFLGTHFTQPILAKQPLFNTTGILFDGIDDWLKGIAENQIGHPCTIYIVLKQVGWTLNEVILEATTSSGIELRQSSTTPQILMLDNAYQAVIPEVTIGAYHLIRIIYNEAQSEYKVDNNAAVVVNVTKAGYPASSYVLGARYNMTALWSNIEVAELIMRHNVDTDVEKQILTNYLLTKYGL